ncbi:MAG: hypothetical protein WCV90_01355 [Candidatus Woesearchaeota archaeon]
MRNYKTIGLALLTLGLAGCGASIQNTETDITRMYRGQNRSGCVTISSTAAYNQGLEAFANSEWGKNIGTVCKADSGDGVDRDTKAYDVFDKDANFVGRVSDHNRAQRLLLKAAEKKNFDYNQQCGLVYSTASYNPKNGMIDGETPLGEQIGLVCNPSREFIPQRDLCILQKNPRGIDFEVYSFEPTITLGPNDVEPNLTFIPIRVEVSNPQPYKWVGEASSCKEAQAILNGLKGDREE